MKRVVLCIGVALTAPLLPAQVEDLVPERLAGMSSRAALIVLGRCVEVRSAWNDRGTLILTHVTYDVERVVKGDAAADRIVLEQLGGTVGTISQAVVGGPSFSVGERSLLFLSPIDGADTFRVYGLDQGKLDVVRDSHGLELVTLKAGPELRGRPIASETPPDRSVSIDSMPLESVIRVVETVGEQR